MALFQTPHLWVDHAAEGVAAIVLDGPGKFNFLNAAALADLDRALALIEADERFRVCVIRSTKSASFCHGVEPATWRGLHTPSEWDALADLGCRVCERLEQCRLPTIAVIAGAALGGGLELALACDWRVAVAGPRTLLGFNELDFGLLPAWGGIGRVVRLSGLERSLQLLLGGRKISAHEAVGLGLVDELEDGTSDGLPAVLTLARKRQAEDLPRRSWRQRLVESCRWGRRLILRGAERLLRRRLPEELPAPWEILGVARIELEGGPAAGRAEARAALHRLAASPACRQLLRLQALKEAHRSVAAPSARPARIGILGVSPLALHLTAQAAGRGCSVALHEHDELLLGMGSLQLVQALQSEVDGGGTTAAQLTAILERVRPTASWKNFDSVELLLDPTVGSGDEAAAMRALEDRVPPHCVIATTQPWRALADWQASLRRPERAAALHFPAPVGQTPIVEILAGPATSPATVGQLQAYAAFLGKFAVVVRDDLGGLINRVRFAGFAAALQLLTEGLEPELIEQASERFGLLHGPLELIDWLGVEETVLIARRLRPFLGVDLGGHPIIQHLLERRWLGIKTGLGFYRDVMSRSRSMNGQLARWLRRNFADRLTPRSQAVARRYVQEQVLGRMAEQAQRCLAEGVCTGPDQLELAVKLAGWAPHRPGPIEFSQQLASTRPAELL
ncbi:MAG: enoyl-CoA hydratase-related protein [Gemmataceae bacterium]|nr:enoyl-CoA hydratase-related protein [Gemmataceae bacterium]